MRVHELAKELNITSKELIEKANETLGLSLKSHSSTVGDAYIDKIKSLYVKDKKPSVKPKAFVVKKQKQPEVSDENKNVPPKEENVIKTVSKLEVVRPAIKPQPQKVKKEVRIEKPTSVKPQVKSFDANRKVALENSTDKLASLPSMTRKNFEKSKKESDELEKKKKE